MLDCSHACSEGHTFDPPCNLAPDGEKAEEPKAEQADRTTQAISALTEAHDLIYGARAASYGDARPHFRQVAQLWSALLRVEVSPEQVAACMALLKIARMSDTMEPDAVRRIQHDNIVDAAGYIGLIEKMQ